MNGKARKRSQDLVGWLCMWLCVAMGDYGWLWVVMGGMGGYGCLVADGGWQRWVVGSIWHSVSSFVEDSYSQQQMKSSGLNWYSQSCLSSNRCRTDGPEP